MGARWRIFGRVSNEVAKLVRANGTDERLNPIGFISDSSAMRARIIR